MINMKEVVKVLFRGQQVVALAKHGEISMRKFEDKANDMSVEDMLFWVSGKNKENWLEEMRQRTR